MKLNKTQQEFLLARSISPSIQPDTWPKWMTNLWTEYLIEVVGNSIYLTDLGFRVLSEEKDDEQHNVNDKTTDNPERS